LSSRLVTVMDYRWVSAGTLALLVGGVLVLSGWGGLLIAATATAIGLIPVLWGSRRMNCMGVLLLPLTIQMAGLGPKVAGWLGLI
jgi:putative membrane protein